MMKGKCCSPLVKFNPTILLFVILAAMSISHSVRVNKILNWNQYVNIDMMPLINIVASIVFTFIDTFLFITFFFFLLHTTRCILITTERFEKLLGCVKCVHNSFAVNYHQFRIFASSSLFFLAFTSLIFGTNNDCLKLLLLFIIIFSFSTGKQIEQTVSPHY